MLRLSAALCSSCSEAAVLKHSDALVSLLSVSHLYKELQISVAPVFGLCHPGTVKRAELWPLIPMKAFQHRIIAAAPLHLSLQGCSRTLRRR